VEPAATPDLLGDRPSTDKPAPKELAGKESRANKSPRNTALKSGQTTLFAGKAGTKGKSGKPSKTTATRKHK
jgi:hypothetical protein